MSTPISQLPISTKTQNDNGTYINEQQKQYIAQAQNAISNNAVGIPQNTKLSSDIIDDDSVAQDILNQINADGLGVNSSIPEPNPNDDIKMSRQQQQYQYQPLPNYNQPMNGNVGGVGGVGGIPMPQKGAVSSIDSLLAVFSDDLKIAGAVFIAVVLAHFLPIENTISKYIFIQKVPYHNIIIKASLASFVAVIILRFIKN